jgi:hypothetical protein
LSISGYQNTPPDFVRGPNGNLPLFGVPPCSVSGNPFPLCTEFNAVTAVNQLAPSSIDLTDLANLTPLAFVAVPGKTPPPVTPVALGSPGANSFLYSVLTGPDGQHTLNMVFDYTPWTSGSLVTGQQLGSFKFPLVVLNNNNNNTTENAVVATLTLTATCTGTIQPQQQGQQGQQGQQQPPCLAATVTGVVGAMPFSAAQLGIQFGLQLAQSPNSLRPHAIFTFQLPVIVTLKTDPVYFGVNGSSETFINQLSGQATAFSQDDRGFTPKAVGRPIGVSPYPAPLCPATGCPSLPPTTSTVYGLCATIAGTPAAATFLSVGTEGTVYTSSPVGTQPQCP